MNQNWYQFLLSQQARFDKQNRIDFEPQAAEESMNRIYPVPHLAVLNVAGKDAAKLLQGQVTCNVNDVGETLSSPGALCNPKGRAIATFLLVKSRDAFLLVLPLELLETVKTRLQKYVLRSDVAFGGGPDEFCVLGISRNEERAEPLFATHRERVISVNLSPSGNRALILAAPDQAIDFWNDRVEAGFAPSGSEQWRCLDLLSGFPWLNTATSEAFVPQMLNLDKLGGISFNKGCYTGQEIVARTHYLGKTKRALYLAECDGAAAPEPNSAIIGSGDEPDQNVGHVVAALGLDGRCVLQAVLQLAEDSDRQLSLKDHPDVRLRLSSFKFQ